MRCTDAHPVYISALEAVRWCRNDSELIEERHIVGVTEVDVADRARCIVHNGRRYREDAQFFYQVWVLFDAQVRHRYVATLRPKAG